MSTESVDDFRNDEAAADDGGNLFPQNMMST